MQKHLSLTNILRVIALFFLGGIIFVFTQPSGPSFNNEGATFDTSSFTGYERGEVMVVLSESSSEDLGAKVISQSMQIKLLTGEQQGEVVNSEYTRVGQTNSFFEVGDVVVLGRLLPEKSDALLFGDKFGGYVVVDRWRLPGVIVVMAVFVILAVGIGRMFGLRALIGLGLTGATLLLFTAPQMLAGKNAILVSLISAGLIATFGLFLAHGYNTKTKLAVLSTLVSLTAAVIISGLFVILTQLFGLGQSESFTIQAGYLGQVDLRGLLFGGMVIALLGVLDDVTTTQTAAVAEIHSANPDYTLKQLFSSSMHVGREHIASLINTLILVYVGASLPLFLLLVAGSHQPVWTLLNSEFMAEEIVRALSGSTALILAVPISSWLAAWYMSRKLR